MKFTGLFYSLACLVLVACSGGGGGSSSNSPETVVSKKSIEALMGAYLQNPVNQCGSGLSDKEKITEAVANASVVNYESGPVRPLAISADNKRLFVTNTPANCLEIYEITDEDTLTLVSTVSVGVDPVAVAVRNENEVWVINHVSDSVSVVRLDGTPRVLRTLQVGDEPRDIVFAGQGKNLAFITTASRGQNKPGFTSDKLLQPGLGRADVWVFDADQLGESLNGDPLQILTLNSDIPRALAASPDGKQVFAAAFHSGNGTTTLHRDVVNKRDLDTNSSTFNTLLQAFNLKPASPASADSKAAPETSLIVRKNAQGKWADENGQDLSSKVKFDFTDDDVFVIDASGAKPVLTTTTYAGVGTTLFNMVFSNNKLFVSNTEALNEVRFEGSGDKSSGKTVKGHMIDSRITVIDTSSNSVTPVNLNSHLSFPADNGVVSAEKKAKTLSQPTAMVSSPDGSIVYVAGFASGKIEALAVSRLNNAFQPDAADFITVPAGPAGLALKTDGSRLFVYSRIDHKLSIIKTTEKTKTYELAMFSPESASVIAGRRLMYDADNASGNGSVACGSCHVFSDLDHLAWDLGNPDERTVANTNSFVQSTQTAQSNMEKNINYYVTKYSYILGDSAVSILNGLTVPQKLEKLLPASLIPIKSTFHPVKGPMTTQTLKGMRGNGPMHWRGDRMGSNKQTNETLEEAAFKDFNDSFVSLLGRGSVLTSTELQDLTNFALKLSLPPNPIRALDNSLTAQEQAGKDIYFNKADVTGLGSCNNCHTLDAAKGQFGTAGLLTYEGTRFSDNFKVPHLRNIYQKVGMFGYSLEGSNQGKQYRGFGLGNDGSVDTLVTFFSDPVFVFDSPATDRKNMAAFVLAFDSDYLPVTGQQLTWRPGTSSAISNRLALLKQQAKVTTPRPACDLQVSGYINGANLSGLFQSDGSWKLQGGKSISDSALMAMATASQPLTFTCLPPGTGTRTALKTTQ